MARMRRIPGVLDAMKEMKELFIENPERHRGQFASLYEKEGPLHAEFGCGKGKFIVEMAQKNPQVNYLAVDLIPEVLYIGMKRAEKAGVKNVRFVHLDLRELGKVFTKGEIQRIYLNFSDPWPKSRHAKRRLTHERFLTSYEEVLATDGWIHFKTDNRDFFAYSLNEFARLDLIMRAISLDLHAHEPEDNVRTRYEEKFSAKGQPIYRVEVTFR